MPAPQAARPLALLVEQGAPSHEHSLSVQVAGSCCWKAREEGPKPGLSLPSAVKTQPRVHLSSPFGYRNTIQSLHAVVPFNGAKAEPPPQVTPALVPSHLTQLCALLQLLLHLKSPAKEGEQKRSFFPKL